MTYTTDRPRMHAKTAEWSHRRRVWMAYLGTQRMPAGLTGMDGTSWDLVAPNQPRVWLGSNGMYMLQGDLAGLLAAQDVQARRPPLVALRSALRHAARAARWRVRGALRTPAVRLVAACLLTAALVGLLVGVL